MWHTLDRHVAGRATVLLGVALIACGGDSTGPANTELTGTWDYVITDAIGDRVNGTCSMSGIVLEVSGTTGTVTANGTDNIACVSGSTTTRPVSGTTSLQNLSVNGSSVTFQFANLSSQALSSATPVISTGTISGNGTRMSGTVTFALLFVGAGARAFSGSWVATRR